MCGIVGLLVKNPALRNQLGALMVPMLVGMTERGPDSAGWPFTPRRSRVASTSSACTAAKPPWIGRNCWCGLPPSLRTRTRSRRHGNHAVLVTAADPDRLSPGWRTTHRTGGPFRGSIDRSLQGRGAPADIAERYGFKALRGSHLVGHTAWRPNRRVTPAHAHPFTAGRDFSLVHNGSLSNPHLVAQAAGAARHRFETDTTPRPACRF